MPREYIPVELERRIRVAALHLANDPDAIEVRSYWIAAGWHPPTDID